MATEIDYPLVDPVLVEVIHKMPQLPQVQYSTLDQLKFLVDVAVKLGLYDAVDILNRLVRYDR